MAEFKASDAVNKYADGEESVQDESDIEVVPEDFKAVQNHILRQILFLLPWLIMFIIIYILKNYRLGPGVLMYISGMLAAALSLIAFSELMKKIPETFSNLWRRGIIVKIRHPSPSKKIEDGKASEVAALKNERLIKRFRQFIQNMQKTLNHPYQWAMGVAFSLLVFTWDWSNPIEFFIAFIIGLMAWRMFITSIYIWKLGVEFCLEPKLGHPDKSGGLSPLGNLCLWNALIITIPAIHLGGWSILKIFAKEGSSFYKISETYAPLYLGLLFIIVVFAIVTFFLPLFNVHWIMEKWKKRVQERLNQLERSINHLESRLLNETERLDQKEFESIQKELERMQQVYTRNDRLPVWPFNIEIMIKFLISQVIPILGIISQVTSLLKQFK